MFELSPVNKLVTATQGRLLRHFPDHSIDVPLKTCKEPDFIKTIATTLSKMSSESVPGLKPTYTVSQGSEVTDESDAVRPTIVRDLLFGFLSAYGKPAEPRKFWKRTRDEALFSEERNSVWRRSPLWLLLRVLLQERLSKFTDSNRILSDNLYKAFMIYFMSHLLTEAVAADTDSDTLFIMNAKIGRRLCKLKPKLADGWMKFVSDIRNKTQAKISGRWNNTISMESIVVDMGALATTDFDDHLEMNLKGLDEFLANMTAHSGDDASHHELPQSSLKFWIDNELPVIDPKLSDAKDKMHKLMAVELWVAENLHSWLEINQTYPDTCLKLRTLAMEYHNAANKAYSDQPEALSLMYLTIVELWVACDKSAIANHPLLAEYQPPMHDVCWSPLILRLNFDMERLFNIENYIANRHARAVCSTSAFSDFPTTSISATPGTSPESFSVRFVESSEQHSKTLNNIRGAACELRNEKELELRRLHDRYLNLTNALEDLDCVMERDNSTDPGDESTLSCRHCTIVSQLRELRIEEFQEPLPPADADAKALIFELALPTAFGDWRVFTLALYQDVLGYDSKKAIEINNKLPLSSYGPLSVFAQDNSSSSHITYVSAIPPPKPLLGYRADLLIEDVCADHALKWKLADLTKKKHLAELKSTEKLSEMCTFQLPPSSEMLQPYLYRPAHRPGPEPNAAVANRSRCAKHMSLRQYEAISSLLLGDRVRWTNLLLHLSDSAIDWRSTEAAIFVQQLFQAGVAANSAVRETHQILRNEDYARAILDTLSKALSRIQHNTDAYATVATYSAVASKILAHGLPKYHEQCRNLLAACRNTCTQWIVSIKNRVEEASDPSEHVSIQARLFEIALVCCSTFYLDNSHLEQTLSEFAQALKFTQCSIMIQERLTSYQSDDPFHRCLFYQWQRISFLAVRFLANETIVSDKRFLNAAILEAWSAFEPMDRWRNAECPWLTIDAKPHHDGRRVKVYFNTLTAEILVNGYPINYVPSEYSSNQDFVTLFGKAKLEAIPCTSPGLNFSAKQSFEGYKASFGLVQRQKSQAGASKDPVPNLRVLCTKHGKTFHFIPSRLFQGVLPDELIRRYVHWYDRDIDRIEFRPKPTP
jgi:hypothetical protein